MNIIYHKIEVEDVRTILSHKHFEYSNEYLEMYRDEIVYPIPGRIGPLEVIAQSPNRIVVKGTLHAFAIWLSKVKGGQFQDFTLPLLIKAIWELRQLFGDTLGEAIIEDFRQVAMGNKVLYKGELYISLEQVSELPVLSVDDVLSGVEEGLIKEYKIYDQEFYRIEDVLAWVPILETPGDMKKNDRRSEHISDGIKAGEHT